MSRAGPSTQRALSATEELEKLEQSITLTLQEIDHNFSKAHRIVTTSILPLVEQYGEHSRNVWEASKFWKQFFEASANVSLSGYEELANDEDTTAAEETLGHDETTADYTPRPRSAGSGSAAAEDYGRTYDSQDESLLTDGDGDLTGSTPRPPATKTLKPQVATMESAYENLKRELKGEDVTSRTADLDDESMESQLLAQHTARLPDMSMTPRSSLDQMAEELEEATAQKNKDPLLHRLLDKNYRIQATPHKPISHGISPIKWKVTDKQKEGASEAGKGKDKAPAWQDSPMSSPEMAVPTLRSEVFMSPIKAAYRGKFGTAAATAAAAAPRTPGVSVQTPATARRTKDVFASKPQSGHKGYEDEITWESDEDDALYGGMSPPKTIQFALPAAKLLQTPAREASKRIVEDILMTAGAEPDESAEYSPTMVKMSANILDDTF